MHGSPYLLGELDNLGTEFPDPSTLLVSLDPQSLLALDDLLVRPGQLSPHTLADQGRLERLHRLGTRKIDRVQDDLSHLALVDSRVPSRRRLGARGSSRGRRGECEDGSDAGRARLGREHERSGDKVEVARWDGLALARRVPSGGLARRGSPEGLARGGIRLDSSSLATRRVRRVALCVWREARALLARRRDGGAHRVEEAVPIAVDRGERGVQWASAAGRGRAHRLRWHAEPTRDGRRGRSQVDMIQLGRGAS